MSGSQRSRSSSIDLPTLIVTAVASATAAYVTSKLWAPGTLGAAAFTPVLIAVLKEMLYKPAEVVTRVVPVRGVVRSTAPSGEPQRPPASPEVVEERVPQPGEAAGVSRGPRGRNWKVAVVTGLLGFVLAAVIITVPELVAGGSAAGGGRETTFFGGGNGSSTDPSDTTTTTPDETEIDGVPPASTVTLAEPETITVPPAETTPVPQQQPPPAEESPAVPAAPGSPPAPAP